MAPHSNHATRVRGRFVDTVVDGISDLGGVMLDWVMVLGDVTLFFARTIAWIFTRLPRRETLLPNFYQIGVLSLPVVALTVSVYAPLNSPLTSAPTTGCPLLLSTIVTVATPR